MTTVTTLETLTLQRAHSFTLHESSKNMEEPEISTEVANPEKEVGKTVVHYDSKTQTMTNYLMAIVLTFILTGAFYVLMIVFAWSLYASIMRGSVVASTVLVLLIVSCYYPKRHFRWQEFIDHPIWKAMCQYFSFRVVRVGEEVEYHRGPYLCAEFPHGIFPLGFLLSSTALREIFPHHSPDVIPQVDGAVASVLFRIPVIRQLVGWFASGPATRRNLKRVLQKEKKSVGLMAGGIAEIFLTSREEEKIYLKNRKGFVKLALQLGTPLIPVYYFGNTQLFDFVAGSTMSRLSRKLKLSMVVYYGRFFLPIPYQHPITMVVGRPIPVPKVERPSSALVDQLHTRFVNELQKLYDDHRHLVGWEHKPLIIT